MKRKALWALIGVFLLGMGGGVLLDRAYLGFWGGGQANVSFQVHRA